MNRDYSRTEYVFGSDALQKMQRASFLIIGADGLAQEIAKNLALTGVAEIKLYDPTPASYRDLAASPFIRVEDVRGSRLRDQTIAPHIQQLNPMCTVSVVRPDSGLSIANFITQAQVVIQTRGLLDLPLGRLGDVCHANNVPYIMCTANGLSARLFCDFLSCHTIFDADGERCDEITLSSCIVEAAQERTNVSALKDWRFFFATYKMHELSDNYVVQIRDVKFVAVDANGVQHAEIPMAQLEAMVNDRTWTVSVTGHSRLEACPCDQVICASINAFLHELKGRGLEALHLRGGYMKRVKEPLDMPFYSYSDAASSPQFSELMIDFAKLGRLEVLHAIYCVITEATAAGHNCAQAIASPASIWNEVAAHENLNGLITFCKTEAARLPVLAACLPVLADEANKEIYKTFLMTYNGEIAPLVSFIGGWGAQEALKCVSGKYTPVHQFYYYECFEALPPRESEFHPLNGGFASLKNILRSEDRYEGQRIVFGDRLQELIANSSLFLVGAGALGCELLKQFALLGAATKLGALLELTDLDTIENSNLSRQFLFREKDIGEMKSEVAAASVKFMNPELNIKARCLRVEEATEDVLNSNFWENKTVIVNALDNVPTRMYVDSRCCLFKKPLLESGTLGQKANMQVVVPWLTETYGSQRDPETGEDPACTIHNFPNTIVHCIVYATSEFKGVFEQGATDFAKLQNEGLDKFIVDLLKNRETIESRLLQLQTLCMKLAPSTDLIGRACIWACAMFERYFIVTIERILHDFPTDAKDKDGNNFWSGEKRPPRKLSYNVNDLNHRDFIETAARLYTVVMGKEMDIPAATISSIAAGYFSAVPSASGKEPVLTNDTASKKIAGCLDNTYTAESITALLRNDELFDQQFLGQFAAWKIMPTAIAFEKDDASNGHVRFIAALSNLRAENYEIKTVDYSEVRRLSGNIIPAMVTTTASIVGLVGIEFYKVILWNAADVKARHPLEDYRSVFLNFALPSLQLSEPGPCTFLECSTTNEKITAWDSVEMSRSATVQDVIDHFSAKYKGEVDSIIYNSRMVYSSFGGGADVTGKRLIDLAGNMPGRVFFLVGCSDPETCDEIEVPRLCLVN